MPRRVERARALDDASAQAEPTPPIGAVGEGLRAAREHQRLSLREFAKQLGLSPSAVSQIERGQVMPSVGTLYAMTSRLGLSMDELFGARTGGAAAPPLPALSPPAALRSLAAGSFAPTDDDAPPAGAIVALTLAAGGAGSPTGRVFPKDERTVITLASGVRWELLTSYEPGVEFLYVVYPVGSESCEADKLISHGGSERGVVLRGRLGVTLGRDHHELGAGDSIAFRSDVPHRLWAIGDEAAEAVWFVTGRNAGG
ncbi:helix-turn-helix domain-containing protein [Conexibacter sp. CPCC 206217]|uniref:helix-turn-helix domain-containing protein n=1 Tax=Conexibacter sp. CPCC 206217 TaxID=3064574 RepID=UPI0027160356|nr:helix-turn-helix domain-containing protein [Conexibacter sp. CPCC 206217]MDO8211896.1 helix-turn-helix domain-containing protein [Conexibacter sp. CPCC 206217]